MSPRFLTNSPPPGEILRGFRCFINPTAVYTRRTWGNSGKCHCWQSWICQVGFADVNFVDVAMLLMRFFEV